MGLSAQAEVICGGEDDSSKQLWAYVVKSSAEQELSSIRDELRARLPGYMLPSQWVDLDGALSGLWTGRAG